MSLDRRPGEELHRLLRESLDERAQALTPTVPARDGIRAALGAVAARRRRRAGLAAAGLAAAVALGTAVQVGVPWRTTTAPAERSTPHAPDDPAFRRTALDTGVVRGSLAGDARWLADLRARVAADRDAAGGLAHPPSPADVHVLYAADVADVRLALVEVPVVPVHEGADTPRMREHRWFSGPRGGSPDAMRFAGSGQASSGAALHWSWPAGRDGVLVVVTAPGVQVSGAGTARIAADGRVTYPTRRLTPRSRGVHEERLRLDGDLRWVHVGKQDDPNWLLLAPDGPPAPALEGAAAEPLYRELLAGAAGASAGGSTPSAADTAQDVHQLANRYGLDVAGLRGRVLWAGAIRGVRAVAVAVTVPSGAHIVGFSGSAPAVVPAGPIEDVALAWAVPIDHSAGPWPRDLLVLAPRGTARVELAEPGGRRSAVEVAGPGVLAMPLDQDARTAAGARVTFVDAAGRTVATATVRTGDEQPPGPPAPAVPAR